MSCASAKGIPGTAAFDGVASQPLSLPGVLLSHAALGAVQGTDARCWQTCMAVAGCNAVTRAAGSETCQLSEACLGQAPFAWSRLRDQAVCAADGAVTLLSSQCRPPPVWRELDFKLPADGDIMLEITVPRRDAVGTSGVDLCKQLCRLTPGCNNIAVDSINQKQCQLKSGCAVGNLDIAPARKARASIQRQRTMYMNPCSEEGAFPVDGAPSGGPHRELPPRELLPSGLLSFDCASAANATAGGRTDAHGAALPGEGAAATRQLRRRSVHAHNLPACARDTGPRVSFPELRWPEYYAAARATYLRAPPADAPPRDWLSADVTSGGERGLGRPTALLRRVAQSVAARSFNGREVVLVGANPDGLPLAINLIANLAKLGHHHALLLADQSATCKLLTRADAPACVTSSLAGAYRTMLGTYGVNAVRLLWLRRYYVMLRLAKLRLNVLMLDADVILFHDPYPFLKGALANYSAVNLADNSAGYAKVNGGVWYLQNVAPGGPVEHLFEEFERRTLTLLDGSQPLLRYRADKKRDAGRPADCMLYDQQVINDVLYSEQLGREAAFLSFTKYDVATNPSKRGRSEPRFWQVSDAFWRVPAPLGTYDSRYPRRYVVRQRRLAHGGAAEWMAQAPPWLFAAESDATPPGVRARGPGRTSASLWGAEPAPVVLVHFVCAAWPGSGGRVTAMSLWGKWFAADIKRQLLPVAQRGPEPRDPSPNSEIDFEAHAWLRACGYACGLLPEECGRNPKKSAKRRGAEPGRPLQPCTAWLHQSSWRDSPLARWAEHEVWAGRDGAVTPMTGSGPGARGAPLRGEPLLAYIRAKLAKRLDRVAPQRAPTTALVMDAMAHLHPQALVAFLHPLVAAGRREYQLWVRVLHSAAMLTGRRPVLPLARCSNRGEWSETSRCVYVLQSTAPQSGAEGRYCVQRPPSICYGRVAMPEAVATIGEDDRATVVLRRLPVLDAGPDVHALALQLNDARLLSKRLLLLDVSQIDSPDAMRSLFVSPKGWLCTLEHKSCQAAC